MVIRYEFLDGTVQEVEVSEELWRESEELRLQEVKSNHKETRRHNSYDLEVEQGRGFADDTYPAPGEQLLLQEEYAAVRAAVGQLSERDQRVFFMCTRVARGGAARRTTTGTGLGRHDLTYITARAARKGGFFYFTRGGLPMKETFFTALTGIGAGIVTTLLGGWDMALEILLVCMALDYLTGFAAAYKTKTLKSSVGYEGLVKKATIFLVVIFAAQLDRLTGNPSGLFRSMTAMFFVANEGLSIVENVGELGVPLPGFITKALEKLKEQNTDTDDTEDDEAEGK